MPLGRNDVVLNWGGANEVTLEVLPFNWPRNDWELLTLVMSTDTGWASLPTAVIAKLNALYNGAHGSVQRGLKGNIVQYVEGTGTAAFTVVDWRGNAGTFVFVPDSGLVLEEIHGSADSLAGIGYHTATIQLVRVASGLSLSGIASAEAIGSHTVSHV